MLNDYEINQEFQDNYRYAHDYWTPYVALAKQYTFAAAGSTWTNEELKELAKEGREPLELNIMRQPIQFFSGYLRDNLNSVAASPVEGSDRKTADQFTKLSYYTWDKGRGYSTFLDAADETLKSGISLCGLYIDYAKDFINGDLGFFKRTYNSFFLDPTFERIDLMDCSFGIMRDLINRKLAKQLLPFVDPKEIDDIPPAFNDSKFLSFNPNFTNLSRRRDITAYDQYYRKTTRTRTFLVDERAGFYRDITDMDDEKFDKLKRGIKRIQEMHDEFTELGQSTKDLPPIVKIQDVERDFVELVIMLNGQRVYQGEDKTGIVDTYPFAPLICYLEPSIWDSSLRVQGIASTDYSNQRQFNKLHMKLMDKINSDIATGYKYIIGAVPDPDDLMQAGQNKRIGVSGDKTLNPDGLAAVEELKGGNADPTLMEYQQVLGQLNLALANVNESVLGVDKEGNTQISGRLAEVRIGQGLRSNRKVFDNIEEAQMILGGLVFKSIQSIYPPEKIQRILNEEPTEQFYNKDFEQYDAVLKPAVRSKSQKDAYYYEIVNLKREGIVDIPQKDIVDNLPMSGGDDLAKSIEQASEAQAAQKAKMDQQEQTEIELKNSKIQESVALTQERRAKTISDIAASQEKISESEGNRAQAALDRAKTITEIAKMSTDRLIQVAQFVNSLEAAESAEKDLAQQEMQETTNQINAETQGTPEDKRKDAIAQVNALVQSLDQP